MREDVKYRPMWFTSDIVLVEDDMTAWRHVKMLAGLFAAACLFPFVLVFMLLFRRGELD